MWGLYAATYREWHFQFALFQQFLSSLDVSSLQELFAEVQNPPLRTHVEIHLKLSQPDVTQMLCNKGDDNNNNTTNQSSCTKIYTYVGTFQLGSLLLELHIVSRENSESEIFMRKSQTETLPC